MGDPCRCLSSGLSTRGRRRFSPRRPAAPPRPAAQEPTTGPVRASMQVEECAYEVILPVLCCAPYLAGSHIRPTGVVNAESPQWTQRTQSSLLKKEHCVVSFVVPQRR